MSNPCLRDYPSLKVIARERERRKERKKEEDDIEVVVLNRPESVSRP